MKRAPVEGLLMDRGRRPERDGSDLQEIGIEANQSGLDVHAEVAIELHLEHASTIPDCLCRWESISHLVAHDQKESLSLISPRAICSASDDSKGEPLPSLSTKTRVLCPSSTVTAAFG